jgi:8-oxo-dGTP pyrophosphatase MutT (NUDIX family)
MIAKPKVFLSYSHDSPAHQKRVLALSERLRRGGIETILDLYVDGTPREGWPRWMLDRLDESDWVLLICTPTYYRRFRGHEAARKGKGVDWEGAIITQEIYDHRSRMIRFIPVLFKPSDESSIPEPVRSQTRYCPKSERGYQALHDALLNQGGVEPGPVGQIKSKPRLRGESLPPSPREATPYEQVEPLICDVRRMADWLKSTATHWGARYAAARKDQTVANSAEGLFLYLAPRRLQTRLGVDPTERQKQKDAAVGFLLSRITRHGLPSVSLEKPTATVQCTSLGLYALAELQRRDPDLHRQITAGKLSQLSNALLRSAAKLGWGTDTSRRYESESEARVPFNFWALRALNAARINMPATLKTTERVLLAMLDRRSNLPFGFSLDDPVPRVSAESLFLILLHELRSPELRHRILERIERSNCNLGFRLAFVLEGLRDQRRYAEHERYQILQKDRPSKQLDWLHVALGYALHCLALYRERLKPQDRTILRESLEKALGKCLRTGVRGSFVCLPAPQNQEHDLNPLTFVTAYTYVGLSEYIDAILPANAPNVGTATIEKIGLAVIRGRRLLLVRNEGTSLLIMPGGRVEGKETADQTLKREVHEELSCEVELRGLTYLGEYRDEAANDPGKTVVIQLYHGKLVGSIQIANEIEKYEWFDTVKDDRSRLSKIVRSRILPDLRRRGLLGSGSRVRDKSQ